MKDMSNSESSQEEICKEDPSFKLSMRPPLPTIAKGKRPRQFKGYEAENSLAKILALACKPLTETQIHGRHVTTSTLMAKDANHEGVTFTAKMQPRIELGQPIDLFFRCRYEDCIIFNFVCAWC